MTLNELLKLIPEVKRNLPLCVIDSSSGYSFEIGNVEIENDEYVSLDPPPPCKMSEATKYGEHILMDFQKIQNIVYFGWQSRNLSEKEEQNLTFIYSADFIKK